MHVVHVGLRIAHPRRQALRERRPGERRAHARRTASARQVARRNARGERRGAGRGKAACAVPTSATGRSPDSRATRMRPAGAFPRVRAVADAGCNSPTVAGAVPEWDSRPHRLPVSPCALAGAGGRTPVARAV
ncbi:hypothetical protein GLE_0574 [Lysobacter enzymogenes]|uniref:Uncharacterized protein n=1 Tax=Lysobacter enzymogenes TaxID=69 RepID=A0A0S2DBL6_LYSEN|nr:hypothetical protein GLE_0574 [Lysobacter enzymogenes]